MEDVTGKDLVLTPPDSTGITRQRSKPTLIKIGNRWLSSDGRLHPDLVAEHLLSHGRNNWVKVSELAKVFCNGNTLDSKRRVRKQLFRVFTHLLVHHGEFLVYESVGPNRRTNAVKLLDTTSEAEKQAARPQLEGMRQRLERAGVKYDRAVQVIEHKEKFTVSV